MVRELAHFDTGHRDPCLVGDMSCLREESRWPTEKASPVLTTVSLVAGATDCSPFRWASGPRGIDSFPPRFPFPFG